MKSFEYAAPRTLKEATGLLSERWGETEILAGGTDLVTALKQHLVAPRRVVSLRRIRDLRQIDVSRSAVRLGATVTLDELAGHRTVREFFPSLITAVEGIGSAQITSTGTVGGDLCQRPRCWYYRNGFGLLATRDGQSLVRTGANRHHAIFGTDGPALFVSASSLGPALAALGATLTLAGPNGRSRSVKVSEFFRRPQSDAERETALAPNEILQEIVVPVADTRNATYEIRHRRGLDWPYVTASVACRVQRGTVTEAAVVLGHVAATPWRAEAAGRALLGQALDEQSAARAGEAATQGAQPLSENGYKVAMVRTAVKRALLAAAKA